MKRFPALLLCAISLICAICGCSYAESSVADTVVYGNVITMDDANPTAEAVAIKDGIIVFVGSKEDAEAFVGENTQTLDYGGSSVYPGFLEAHTHGFFAGYRAVGQADLSGVFPTDYEVYGKIIGEFIAEHPDKDLYLAAGWVENEEYVTKAYMDEICSDKPLIMNTDGGHACLLNTKALEWAGIDAAYAKEVGYDLVHVDENGEPDGYISEMPAIELIKSMPVTQEEKKNYLLQWQDFAISKGFTAVADAGAELFCDDISSVYHELEEEGKLKLRTYSYLLVPDNVEDPSGEIARIVKDRESYSGEYYHIIGAKAFLDGTTEGHTAWQAWDYLDQPGYHGLERFNDHDKMVELITAAEAEDLSVHVHSIGGGATRFMLDCIEDAEKITGNLDQRNVMAHLEFVEPEDVIRMAETHTIPAVAPLWTPKFNGEYELEASYVGQEHVDNCYPIRSFYDAGACVVFHSDYPISPNIGVQNNVYMAELRAVPEEENGGLSTQRNIKEAVTRMQSLRAMTTNVAYAWRQEDRMGSLEVGKLANLTVCSCDFLNDDAAAVANADVVATIIDGKEVYHKRHFQDGVGSIFYGNKQTSSAVGSGKDR